MRNYSKIYMPTKDRLDPIEASMSELRENCNVLDIEGIYYIPRDAKMGGL